MNSATLRVGTWNILGRRHDEQLSLADEGAVQRTLRANPVDVLCLQEVHFFDGHPDEQLCRELRIAGLTHFVGSPLSPSHLDPRAELGVCIAARFPLRDQSVYRFANPGLRARVRGQDWFLHDKGLIGADLEVGWGTRVRVYSLHLFPFFEFGVGDADVHVSRMWRELWQYVDQLSGSAGVILAGDYNHTGRAGAAKEWSEHPWTFCVPQGMTTTRIGLSLDDIAINWTAPPDFVTVRDTFSDHHLVIAGLPHAGLPGGRHRRVAQSKFPVR